MVQSFTIGQDLPPPESPFVDPKTGRLSNDGYQFLMSLINQAAQAVTTVTVADNLEATGATQATATQLTAQWNIVTSVPIGSGVLLDQLDVGQSQTVFNDDVAALNVYPPAGMQIDAQAVNAPYSLLGGARITFDFLSETQIRS